MTKVAPPGFEALEAARQRLDGVAVRTPLLSCDALDTLTGARVLIKPENLQKTGSFKFRGAWNRISQLTSNEAAGGVVAYSSGNHAQGVAAVAAIHGFASIIVMPEDTPDIKKVSTRAWGSEIVTYPRGSDIRDHIVQDIIEERGAVLVPPFDDADIIAGQGTCGLELIEDAKGANINVDTILVCTGGGGLTAGITLAAEALSPGTAVYGVEPATCDDFARSFHSGQIESNAPGVATICDALMTPRPGQMTLAISKPRLAGVLTVDDNEVKAAMRFAFTHLKLVLEPGGAAALAATMSGKINCTGKTIAIIATGGNVDPALYAKILNDEIQDSITA